MDFYGERYICDAENYVAFDIETTGLDGSEIVDFAAIRIRDGIVDGACNGQERRLYPLPYVL